MPSSPVHPFWRKKSQERIVLLWYVNPKHLTKLQNFRNLWNILKSFQKSSEIVRSSSETLTLCRIKISCLWFRKSWQVQLYRLSVWVAKVKDMQHGKLSHIVSKLYIVIQFFMAMGLQIKMLRFVASPGGPFGARWSCLPPQGSPSSLLNKIIQKLNAVNKVHWSIWLIERKINVLMSMHAGFISLTQYTFELYLSKGVGEGARHVANRTLHIIC